MATLHQQRSRAHALDAITTSNGILAGIASLEAGDAAARESALRQGASDAQASAAFLAALSLFAPGLPLLAALLVPCALTGYAIGSRVNARMPQARVRRVIWFLLLAASASLLLRGVMGSR
jgi:hypothetical protein